MLGASGALLQAAETAAGGAANTAASSVGAHEEVGAQVERGVSIMDEDSKGGEGGSDELAGGGVDRGFLSGGSGGNRWPRQETLALLKIRSDMDFVFRDSSLKGPLWEEVARKMAELGYHRSAKKCKEKFENVYKYHKRTRDVRATKANGKTYRFFDQLEAFESTHGHHHSSSMLPPSTLPPPPPPAQAAVPISMAMPPSQPQPQQPPTSITVTVPSSTANPLSISSATVTQSNIPPVQPAMQAIQQNAINPVNFPNSPSGTASSSSSTSSDEEILGMRRKRKRKWKDFLERLMKEVIGKQEELQRKFLEAIEKREHERMVREEAWKVQEMARLNREHEILVQERSMAANKDAALISFLQKLSDQQQIPLPPPVVIQPQQPQPQPRPPAPSLPVPAPVEVPETATAIAQLHTQLPQQPLSNTVATIPSNVEVSRTTNNGDPNSSYLPPSSSRWPKTEVQALIKLRTSLDQKYQDSGPKGPLWEEISSAMKRLGYNRNAKRCKEKWENINKYFKKVKESNKKRPEDSKTCPYFHQLDQLYREKNNKLEGFSYAANNHQPELVTSTEAVAAPIMAQPEQQWPLSPQQEHDPGSDNMDEDDDEEEDDDQGGRYEIVANNNNASSMAGASAAAIHSS